jgi:magnesium transporter
MNFEHMPELDDPYAYPAALGLMATLGLGGAWAFYKRGWFG